MPSYPLSQWKFCIWLWPITPPMIFRECWKQLLPLLSIQESYNFTVHSKVYAKMMILPASTCRRHMPSLLNLLRLENQSPWQNSTYMCLCFKGYVATLMILSPSCLLRLILSPTLIFIAVFLNMNFSIKLLFNLP